MRWTINFCFGLIGSHIWMRNLDLMVLLFIMKGVFPAREFSTPIGKIEVLVNNRRVWNAGAIERTPKAATRETTYLLDVSGMRLDSAK